MATPEERLEEAADLAENASAIASDWANGPSRDVTPEPISGPLPTIKKFLESKSEEIDNAANAAAVLRQEVIAGTAEIRDVKHVASVAALQLLEGEYEGQAIELDKVGMFAWRSSSTKPESPIVYQVTGVTTGRWEMTRGQILSDLTVKIPTDYPTLQAAVDDLRGRIVTAQGAKINLQIESGHQLTDGLLVTDGDYGYFYITSVDAEVSLNTSAYPVDKAVCRADAANAPVLATVVNVNGFNCFGYVLRKKSQGRVLPQCGVKGADVNLQVFEASTIDARSTVFTDAVAHDWGRNVWISSASKADMQLFDNLNPPTNTSGAERRNIYVSRGSTLNFANGISTNSQTDAGLYVIRSWAVCNDAVLTGNALYGLIASSGSVVDARNVNADNSGVYGIWADVSATVAATGATANSCGQFGFRSSGASIMNAGGSTATLCGSHGAYVSTGSILNTTGATLGGTNGDLFNDEGGISYRNSSLDFGSVISEKGARVIQRLNPSSNVTVVKFSDGTMEQTYSMVEMIYGTSNRLQTTITFSEAFFERPTGFSVTPYHRNATFLPSTPSHFSEFAGQPSPSILIRNASAIDMTIYAANASASYVAGNNAYVSVTVTGRWK